MLDCGAPFGLADLLPLLGPPSRSPVLQLLLLLLLLLYVLPRSHGTGPLVLGGSALLLDEQASAGLPSNTLVIFREAEVAFLAARVLAFGPGLRPVALLVLCPLDALAWSRAHRRGSTRGQVLALLPRQQTCLGIETSPAPACSLVLAPLARYQT